MKRFEAVLRLYGAFCLALFAERGITPGFSWMNVACGLIVLAAAWIASGIVTKGDSNDG